MNRGFMDTSQAAYDRRDTTRLENLVFAIIKSYGSLGCISDQVRRDLSDQVKSYSSVTARFAKLKRQRRIFDTEWRAPGESNRGQAIMVAYGHLGHFLERQKNTATQFPLSYPRPTPHKKAAVTNDKEERTRLTCSICNSPGDLDGEGGIAGDFGVCSVAFCVWCHASIVDMVSQGCSRCQEDTDDAGYRRGD